MSGTATASSSRWGRRRQGTEPAFLTSLDDGEPEGHHWVACRSYTKSEPIADGVVHILGLALAVCGGMALMLLASRSAIATAAVYATSLVMTLGFSAAYNMWRVSGVKRLLREFSRIRNTQLRRFTLDRMIAILGKLDEDVEVNVSFHPRRRPRDHAVRRLR